MLTFLLYTFLHTDGLLIVSVFYVFFVYYLLITNLHFFHKLSVLYYTVLLRYANNFVQNPNWILESYLEHNYVIKKYAHENTVENILSNH